MAVEEAREAGFENISLDLIYGIPGQTLDTWKKSLEAALSLRPEHLSLYSLTVEQGTTLAAKVAGGEIMLHLMMTWLLICMIWPRVPGGTWFRAL